MHPSETSRTSWRDAAVGLAGLAVLLAANYYLRHVLEDAPRYLYSFMERFYAPEIPVVFAKPWWQLLLPLREFTGAWATTTMVQTYLLERWLTPAGVWYLYNAIAMLVAFGASWALFRSAVFSFTFTIAIGFGTQFYHAYAVTGGIASYIVAAYHMLLMFTATQIVRGARPAWLWYAGLAVSLAFNMLGYEGWLDVLALTWGSVPFVYVALRRLERPDAAARFMRVAGVITAAGAFYLVIKIRLGYGQVQGSESDVLFNYGSWWMIADDLISNVFTHTYLSVSNFLPPVLVGASAMYQLGAEHLIQAQHGHHEPYLYLVPMHQVFFWRYYAGAAFVLVCYALYRACVRMWRAPSPWTLALMLFLLMILLPGSTHTMIKFRPMNAMPTMTYHVTVGVIGAAALLAWLSATAWHTWRHRRAALTVVMVVWGALFYGALARPVYLSYMSAQAGLGNMLYPNPMRTLVEKLGGVYAAPHGLVGYQLMPYKRDDQIAAARLLLGNLPNPLPPLAAWLVAADGARADTPAAGGLELVGDDTQYGYQLVSPPIDVRPESTYLFRVRFAAEAGRVCAGLLTGDQQRWLVPPDGATAELVVHTGQTIQVRVVLANCYLADAGNPRSHVVVTGGSFGIVEEAPPTP